MRIVWKDSSRSRDYKPIKYRGHMISGSAKGWETDIPTDKYLYLSHYCAQNAIDKMLGGTSRRGSSSQKRINYGIKIVGEKE